VTRSGSTSHSSRPSWQESPPQPKRPRGLLKLRLTQKSISRNLQNFRFSTARRTQRLPKTSTIAPASPSSAFSSTGHPPAAASCPPPALLISSAAPATTSGTLTPPIPPGPSAELPATNQQRAQPSNLAKATGASLKSGAGFARPSTPSHPTTS